jgi:hypothetical protein
MDWPKYPHQARFAFPHSLVLGQRALLQRPPTAVKGAQYACAFIADLLRRGPAAHAGEREKWGYHGVAEVDVAPGHVADLTVAEAGGETELDEDRFVRIGVLEQRRDLFRFVDRADGLDIARPVARFHQSLVSMPLEELEHRNETVVDRSRDNSLVKTVLICSRYDQRIDLPSCFLRLKLLHSNGYRFLLHQKDLPGKPAATDANYAFARTAPFLTDGPRRASAIAAIS